MSGGIDDAPNPGSPEAIEQGCTCPRMDNANGRGYMGGARDENGNIVFVYAGNCPLHAPEKTEGQKLVEFCDRMMGCE